MLRMRKINQQGDTIVEVLIAIMVVSLVLVTAYAATTRNVSIMQDTEEHSEALQLAQTQLEFLRNSGLPAGDSCFSSTGSPESSQGGVLGNDPCFVNSDGDTLATDAQTPFQLTVTKLTTPAPDGLATYNVRVIWYSLTHSSENNVTLYYQT
jgi:type II secretory pathway pseudopilin PulG